MKKKLLLGAFLFGSFLTVKAQDSCAEAVVVTPGTYTVDAINGTFGAGCWQTAADNAEWYSYTPSENSLVTVRTDIDANPAASTDTRFSVFTGTCGDLTCYSGNDDVSGTDYRSAVTFPAEAGTTYYIAFDNRWLSTGFDFELSAEAVSCFTPTGFAYSTETPPTTTDVTLVWNAPLVGTVQGYEYEYGPQGFEPGSGIETVEVTEAMATMSNLDPSTVYDLYVRSVCSDTDSSEWVGPLSFNTVFEPVSPDYTYGFEEGNFAFGGWSTVTANQNGGVWEALQAGQNLPAQEGDFFAGVAPSGAASDTWLFSRGVTLTQGDEITLAYYVRQFISGGTTGNTNSLVVSVGTERNELSQSTILNTHSNITEQEFTLKNATFTVPADGVYYFGFRCNSPAHTQASNSYLLLDNVIVDSQLGIEDLFAFQLSIFPNPASDIINIVNNETASINGVEIVDINGRTVKFVRYNGVSEAQINISDLSAGMYLMNVSSDQGTTTKKIVKK